MLRKTDVRVEKLAGVSLFQSCSPSELRELAGITNELDVTAGTVLCHDSGPGVLRRARRPGDRDHQR